MTTAFIENIQQTAYWEAQSLRAQAFRPPQILGKKLVRGRRSAVIVGGKDYHKWIDKSTFEARELPMLPDGMEGVNAVQMNLEQQHRANAINFALFQKAKKEVRFVRKEKEKKELEEEQEALAEGRRIVILENEQDCLELFNKLSKSKFLWVAAEANIALAKMELLKDDERRQELLEKSVDIFRRLIQRHSGGEDSRLVKWAQLFEEASDELKKFQGKEN